MQVNITKPKFANFETEVTDNQICEIKINSVPKNTKDLCKNTKTFVSVNIPR